MAKANSAANAADQNSSMSQDQPEQGSVASAGSNTKSVASSLGRGDVGAATSEATEQVQKTVSGLGDQLRQQATGQATTQKERAAGGIETVAQLLRQAGQQVREQDQVPIAESIDGVAERVEQWSDSLRMRDVSQLVDDTKQLARRQPTLFVGGALALGFLGVRFFKSSPQENTTNGQTAPNGDTSFTKDADAAREAFFAETPSASEAGLEDMPPPSKSNTASAETQ